MMIRIGKGTIIKTIMSARVNQNEIWYEKRKKNNDKAKNKNNEI